MAGSGDKSETELDCEVTTIQDKLLYCDMPQLDSTYKKYVVTVYYGSIVREEVGTVVVASDPQLPTLTIVAICVSCGVIFVIVIITIVVLKCRLSRTDQGMKKLQDKMDNLEMTVAKECKEGTCNAPARSVLGYCSLIC